MSTPKDPRIVARIPLAAFGGQRVAATAAANLWDDGVVLASAFSADERLSGSIFTYRGEIKRSPAYYRTVEWTLRDPDGTYRGTFKTRKDAIGEALRRAQMDLIRTLNERDPQVHTIGGRPIGPDNRGDYGRTHDMRCPACLASGSSFTASPRSESYWSS